MVGHEDNYEIDLPRARVFLIERLKEMVKRMVNDLSTCRVTI